MLGWLRGIIAKGAGLLGQGLSDLGNLALEGVTSVISFIFGDVGSAWDDMTTAWHFLSTLGSRLLWDLTAGLWHVITYDIPHYAMTAWWWVNHPAQLADVLGWHLVRFLEERAWAVAEYLGEFILALLLRNVRRVALLAEHILTAIL
jgi:hypothetical protein